MTNGMGRESSVLREIARWTHLWASAARQIEAQILYDGDAQSPASSIGAMDALTLTVIDAVHNTYRGACVVLGHASSAVASFESSVPDIKKLRNRLEHFDEYLRGEGFAQKVSKTERLALGDASGVAIPTSSGGPDGHVIIVHVHESDGEHDYRLAARPTVEATRRLARSVIAAVGLYDERHQHCPTCL